MPVFNHLLAPIKQRLSRSRSRGRADTSSVTSVSRGSEDVFGAPTAQQGPFQSIALSSSSGFASHSNIESDQINVDELDNEVNQMNPSDENYVQKLRELSRLCSTLGRLPRSYILSDELIRYGDCAHAYGGFSDVWKARYGDDVVAVKVIRVHVGDESALKKMFCNEVTYWKRLKHPYIVPFLGISSRVQLSIISEWMVNGDIVSYLELHPEIKRLPLILQAASAMEYMHSSHMVHGDIKGHNILINIHGHACLSDFGLAVTVYNTQSSDAMRSSTGRTASPGTIRWSAPERLVGTDDPRHTMPTIASDVYSFGITMWEVYTLQVPFYNYRQEWSVISKILDAERPSLLPEIPDQSWPLMENCWAHKPHDRPDSASICMQLRERLALELPEICSQNQEMSLAEGPRDPPTEVLISSRSAMACLDTDNGTLTVAAREQTALVFKATGFTEAAVDVVNVFPEPFAPLKITVKNMLAVMQRFENIDAIQNDFTYAAQKLTVMKAVYQTHRSQLDASDNLKPCLEVVARTIQIVERTVRAKLDRGAFRRILDRPDDCKAIADALRMLGDVAENFVMNVTMSTHLIVRDHIATAVLDQLHFVASAHFLSVKNRRECTEGTRTELLVNILTWGTAVSGVPKICWLNGPAGWGKSTIAQTICSFLRGLNLLGGSFFCSRDDEKRRSAHSIFSTLARSLASYDHEYASRLFEVLRKNLGAGSFVAVEQLTSLILGPICDAHFNREDSVLPVRVLVIDALDECEDDDKTIYTLMCTLLAEADRLPLKFLITSRPESRINRAFEQAYPSHYLHVRAQDVAEDTARDDVMTYLRSELAQCAKACRVFNEWPPDVQVEALAKQAGSLFIYASTACKYIWDIDNAAGRLKKLLTPGMQPLEDIDSMYKLVLVKAKHSQDEETWEITRRCLHALCRLRQPLSLRDLAAVLDVDGQQLSNALAGLQSIISIPPLDHPDGVTVFHASLVDYLTDGQRSHDKPWFLETMYAHRDILSGCLSIMKAELRFNISNSRSSYAQNDKQPSRHSIPECLRYACLHWIDHLESCGDLPLHDMADLSELLHQRFLYWLEVLSVTSSAQMASEVMGRLLSWTTKHLGGPDFTPVQEANSSTLSSVTKNVKLLAPEEHRVSWLSRPGHHLREFAADAGAFIDTFAVPIEASCPHIYLSALATTSPRSAIWPGLWRQFDQLPRIIKLPPQNDTSVKSPRGHRDLFSSVAFSQDGTRVVSGSINETVRLRDVATGAIIGESPSVHEGVITYVAFSLDGTRIVSASANQTVHLWDVATGATSVNTLRGHEGAINSVGLSPDGTRIVSGSEDMTIRLWDVDTGAAIGESLRGHHCKICSVAFSPDALRIVSGSVDNTIRLWNVNTWAAIGKPLLGHQAPIMSVVFSPDGTRVASGSVDMTIRLWDVYAGAAIGQPFSGHSNGISCLAFSPDGARLVSGSDDKTIRLWDLHTGAAIGEPLRGHHNAIVSLAFLPDGTRIVSGSSDQTIRLWDVAAGDHGSQVTTHRVAFSQDGRYSTCIGDLLLPGHDPRDILTLSEDGWLRGPKGELFLWVLPEYRLGLWRPRMEAFIGMDPVVLDLSRFTHGNDWARCFSANADGGIEKTPGI